MGNNAKIITVDVRNDRSVVVYYSTGTCRPYKADRLPKTVKAWLDDNGSERVVVKATKNAVVIEAVKEDAEATEQATESTAQTSEQTTENETEHANMIAAIDQARPVKTVSEPLKPLKRWIIPTIPPVLMIRMLRVCLSIISATTATHASLNVTTISTATGWRCSTTNSKTMGQSFTVGSLQAAATLSFWTAMKVKTTFTSTGDGAAPAMVYSN